MTSGQQAAIEQLRRIAALSPAIEVLSVEEPDDETDSLVVEVSLVTKDMPRAPDGLALRDRERAFLVVPPNFPYQYPGVFVRHHRFAAFPHVNWGTTLCMYQAPDTEWSPQGGMVGFLDRLELWFRRAAVNQLDPTGAPMHPPHAAQDGNSPMVIPRINAPLVQGSAWIGFGDLKEVSKFRLDLQSWAEDLGAIQGLAAPTILLASDMPSEFPRKLEDLLAHLEQRGVTRAAAFDVLYKAMLHNGKEKPLYVVLGTPMRGIRGGERKQHLTVWRVDEITTSLVDLERDTASMGAIASDLHRRITDFFQSRSASTDVTWCRVREDRPEVTIPRDRGTPLEAFRGLAVEVWGCGALGTHIAEMLVRAGAKAITVRDSARVTPGVLVRQLFTDAAIGRPKSASVAARLQAIRPTCDVSFSVHNVLDEPLGVADIAAGSDLVIDVTASMTVLLRVEEIWRRNPTARAPIASMVIDATARRGMVAFATSQHSGGPYDVTRRMKLAACNDDRLAVFRDAFFPLESPPPFQPEPGCSDATFIGSAADVAALSAIMLTFLGEELLATDNRTAAGGFTPALVGTRSLAHRLSFYPDLVFDDVHSGFQTRMSSGAWRELQASVADSNRLRGPDPETGGLLFGETSDWLKVMWVTEVCGPPSDSCHSAEEFICGISGIRDLQAEKRERTRRAVQYLGTWHTHPISSPVPSNRDFRAMDLLLSGDQHPPDRLLLLIVGTPLSTPTVTASVFLPSDFETMRRTGVLIRAIDTHSIMPQQAFVARSIGLCLSGGGSRAMAFHLGCLRALHDIGLLQRVNVLSSVSGGAVIGAMYAYSNDTFDDFDQRVRTILRQGLAGGIARRTFVSWRVFSILLTQSIAGIAAASTYALRVLAGTIERLLPSKSRSGALTANRLQPPFRRWVSRTDALVATLRDRLFGRIRLNGPRRANLNIVINACELRTGTAFRFGSRETGSWKFGITTDEEIDVAFAVAASAAYPLFLPALDRSFSCTASDSNSRKQRLVLTDGGVYDNLGLSCLEPGKDSRFSTNVYRCDYLLCCDAGPGEFDHTIVPYGLLTRAARSFESTYRQVQHGMQAQLHAWHQTGAIEGFLYAYLGQQDSRLPAAPPDLVQRSQVVHYPTDFSSMSENDIELLARRGYQLTRLLIARYLSDA